MKVFFWGETLVFGFSCQNGPKCSFSSSMKIWSVIFFYLGSWDYKGENELQNELTKWVL